MSTIPEPDFDQLATELLDKVLRLGHVSMEFAEVKRLTGNLSGGYESDTDHTVMLSLLACSLARYDQRLDVGKVAQYALVHDLVEVYAGDVHTLRFDKIDFKRKEADEAQALAKLNDEFGTSFPWLIETIRSYEKLTDPEARFVKTLDKCMPALTHLFNESRTILDEFDSVEALRENAKQHRAKHLSSYGADQPLVMAIHKQITAAFIEDFAAQKSHAK